eukprot:Nitzschia sp. Nitz4//scaffold4_size323378//26076//29144//NITZ4_000615-RA/size323378-augustus-gene-0.29-mRNA-1//-1//CDS//3329553264//8608//frame0
MATILEPAGAGVANPQMPQPTPQNTPMTEKEVMLCQGPGVNLPSVRKTTQRSPPTFKVGLIIDTTTTSAVDRHISSFHKPATPCSLASIVVRHPPDTDEARSEAISRWMSYHQFESIADSVSVGWGMQGVDQLFHSDVDAVYIIVPHGTYGSLVIDALEAGKHVLLNDPVSTNIDEFIQQQRVANKNGKVIQFLTLFVHQFKTQRFMDSVLQDKHFGRIHTIEAKLNLLYDDVDRIGVTLPLTRGDGSIRRLARYCVLVGTLFFSQVGSSATSVRVEKVERGRRGQIINAVGVVHYTGDRVLRFDVGFNHSATRQSIELDADLRYATMNDFVLEHPDGLGTYRVYEKCPHQKNKVDLTRGEAIDLSGAPPQTTMMWRTFVDLCLSLDQAGGWDQLDDTAPCRVLANVALQTKHILCALTQSVETLEEVMLSGIESIGSLSLSHQLQSQTLTMAASQTNSPLRVGILGVAGISRKTALAISHTESSCEIRVVASRSLEKAQNFIKAYVSGNESVLALGGPEAYTELLKSDEIDAVYVPLPTSLKKEWVMKALNQGKHVVVEKPVALSSADFDEVLRLARAKNKVVMDGTMFPHHKRTLKIFENLSEDVVGTVHRVDCNFTFMSDDTWERTDIRARKDGDPHGCIGDLGWYCIRFGMLVFEKLGYEPTEAQVVDFDLNSNGVPRDATCVVRFQNGRALWFHCGFKTALRQRFEVCGSKKFLEVTDLVLPIEPPATFMLKSDDLINEDRLTVQSRDVVAASGDPPHEVLLWSNFCKLCQGIDKADDIALEVQDWGQSSLTTQKIVDALVASISQGCKPVAL